MRMHIEKSIKLDETGDPKEAVKENKKAMVILKKLEEVLITNDALFEANIFLLGNSSITRKTKK